MCSGWFEHRWRVCFVVSCVYTCELSPTLTCVRVFFSPHFTTVSEIVTGSRSASHSPGSEHNQYFLCVCGFRRALWEWGRKGRKLGKESEKNEFIAKKSCPSSEGTAANWVTGCTPSPTPGRNSLSRHTLRHLRVLINTR